MIREDILAYICPDVHGRDFWENIIDTYNGEIPVIFLGDYLDPYKEEGVTDKDAEKTFKKIWDFKEKWGDKVILLLGNHDLSYYDYYFRTCRFSNENAEWYCNFLKENINKFKISHSIINNEKTIIFSHAGIHPLWLKYNNLEQKFDSEYINNIFENNPNLFYQYTYYRGGYKRAGSPIWSDIREYVTLDEEKVPEDVLQIVGHTQLITDTLTFNNVTCIDSRQVFVLKKDNTIEPFNKKEEN